MIDFLNKYSIERRFVVTVGLGMFLFSILSGTSFYFYSFSEEVAQANALQTQLVATIQAQAEVGVFTQNVPIASGVIQSLLINPIILAVRIDAVEGFHAEESRHPGLDFSAGTVYPLFSPVDHKEQLGSLVVIQNHTHVNKAAAVRAFSYALVMVLQIVVVTVILVAVFRRQVGAPVTRLAQIMKEIKPGHGMCLPIDERHLHDEIGLLSRCANSLLEATDHALGTAQTANHTLQETLHIVHSSIQYASRIQRSMLPNPEFIQFLLPQHFVVWQPRDVVGGDAYWCRLWGAGVLLVIGDCTGHGVPGAFMTLIANGALGHAINTTQPGNLGSLIVTMHGNMQAVLGQKLGEDYVDDGVELGACYFSPDQQTLLFVGARFSLFYQDPGQPVVELKGDRTGIGYRSIASTPKFTENTLELLSNRRFFLITDGMIDQLGGEKCIGFGKKRFRELLERHKETPIQETGECLYHALLDYQGSEPRLDDVTIFGFSVSDQGNFDAN